MLEAYTVEDEIQLHKFSTGLSGILTPRNPCVHNVQEAENRGTDGEPHWMTEVDTMDKSLQGTQQKDLSRGKG